MQYMPLQLQTCLFKLKSHPPTSHCT